MNLKKKLDFTSLRKIINNKEVKWLDLQGENWDINTDPDNFFIASDFDRTFLNEGAELIIKDDESQEIIHKYFEWGDIQLHIDNIDLLKEINVKNIVDPKIISSLSKNIKVNIVNSTDTGCRAKGHHVSYYKVNGQQLKGFTTQNVGLFDKTLVAKTRGYQWKRGKWRNRRVWIHAGISGINKSSWTAYNNCAGIIPGNPNWKDKKRRKLEYRLPNNSNIIKLTVKNNLVYSYHSQSGNSIFVDFYDYNSVPINN